MAAPMEKTKTPGVFKRGNRYVVVFRDGEGRQRKVAARTLAEARKLKGARTADVARGEFHPQSRERFRKYAEAWIERYQGTGRRGFRESTRDDYRRLLHEFAFPFFDERRRRRLSEVTPGDIAEFVGWLCDPKAMADLEHEQALEQARADGKPPPERKRDERPLSDSTVRNILKPVRACFATAVREGRVRCTDDRRDAHAPRPHPRRGWRGGPGAHARAARRLPRHRPSPSPLRWCDCSP